MSDQTEIHEIECPKCGSIKWDCWDESCEWFEDENGDLYEFPVGFLKCKDCGAGYIHYDNDDKHIGDDVEAFGRQDGWNF